MKRKKEWLGRLIEEDQIYKIEKFDSVFSIDEGPIDKENLIWEGKFKIGCLRTIRVFKSLFEFIEGLIARKKWF